MATPPIELAKWPCGEGLLRTVARPSQHRQKPSPRVQAVPGRTGTAERLRRKVHPRQAAAFRHGRACPAIHVFAAETKPGRRCPGQTQHDFDKTHSHPARNIRRPRAGAVQRKRRSFSVIATSLMLARGGASGRFHQTPIARCRGAMPLPRHRYATRIESAPQCSLIERPKVLDQAIFVLAVPLASEERNDGGAAFEEFGAITPAAVLGIGQRHTFGIA